MRNLKRVLSLGMTAAMISGLMVTAGAASYSDVTDKENVEAIEVLKAVGVMDGDQNGNFNPSQNVTREEMAVVMCRLLDLTVSSYKGTTQFTDVADWALPYVEACYTNGIIAGYSATEFGGKDNVTTGQAALMIMKALGYFQEAGDFGQDWLVSTTKQGAQINLFDGVANGATEALTRNDVAQLALNALEASCVEIYTHDIVSDGKGGFTTKANYRPRTAVAKWNTIEDNTLGGLQLGEELYEGVLRMEKSGIRDDFGRPATKWVNDLKTVGTFADTPVKTYTAGVNPMDIYNLLGSATENKIDSGKASMSVYHNGADVTLANLDNVMKKNDKTGLKGRDAFDFTDANNNTAEANKFTGNGVLTEVYQNTNGDVTIVSVDTFLVKATGDYNTVKEEVRYEFANSAKAPSIVDQSLSSDDFDNLTDVKDGDYLLITVAYDQAYDAQSNRAIPTVKSVQKATTVTGTVDAYTQNHGATDGKSVTLNGTKYSYAKQSGTDGDEMYAVGQNATLVLDQYGYAIGVAEALVNSNFVYIVNRNQTVSGGWSDDITAAALFADGTKANISVNKVGTDNATKNNVVPGQWYTYTKNADNQYNLVAPANVVGYNADNAAYYNVTAAGQKIVDGDQVLSYNAFKYDANKNGIIDASESVANGLTYLNNKDTVLVVLEKDNTVSTYVGAENMPTIETRNNASGSFVGGQVALKYIEKKTDAGYMYMALLDLTAMDDDYYTIKSTSAKPEFMFILDEVARHYESNGVLYFTYDVLTESGEVKQMTFDHTQESNQYNLIRNATYDKSGYITDSTVVETASKPYFNHVVDGMTVKFNGNTLSFGGYDYITTADTKIYLVAEGETDLVKYAGSSYEVYQVSGAYLAQAMDGRNFLANDGKSSRIAGMTLNANTNVLDTLYVYVAENS